MGVLAVEEVMPRLEAMKPTELEDRAAFVDLEDRPVRIGARYRAAHGISRTSCRANPDDAVLPLQSLHRAGEGRLGNLERASELSCTGVASGKLGEQRGVRRRHE